MTSNVDLAVERFPACLAGERLEPGMLTTVSNEVRRLAEGFATLATHVRFLA